MTVSSEVSQPPQHQITRKREQETLSFSSLALKANLSSEESEVHILNHQESRNEIDYSSVFSNDHKFVSTSDAHRNSKSCATADKTDHLWKPKERIDKRQGTTSQLVISSSSLGFPFTKQEIKGETFGSTFGITATIAQPRTSNSFLSNEQRTHENNLHKMGFTLNSSKTTKLSTINKEYVDHHNDDALSSASTASATTMSPTADPVFLEDARHVPPARLPAAIATPTTVSHDDALSDDEHIVENTFDDKPSIKIDDKSGQWQPINRKHHGDRKGQPTQLSHQRVNSWGETRVPHSSAPPNILSPSVPPEKHHPSPNMDAWGGVARVATFRNETGVHSAGHGQRSNLVSTNARNQINRSPMSYGHALTNPVHQNYQPVRKTHTTPPRARTPRQPHSPLNQSSASHLGVQSARSSSELLKTLLRKKACLYEPGTSRAIALVTWLVGRELALEFGYFSRQQLQSGVHAAVAKKIDANVITRTKVNRCMQIILNSCFHYIIPRPDGTEENGTAFKKVFSESVRDDSNVCSVLPPPWNDLSIQRDLVLYASEGEQLKSGQNNTKLASASSGNTHTPEVDDHSSKRAVLLCFNENVRSADDVLRCHHEFIRDAANSAQLQLTAQEWKAFFGGGTIRAHNPELARDALGKLEENDLVKFRTTWCSKRYDHDHDLCAFAHVEVDGGWLRRDTNFYNYTNQMCPSIIQIPEHDTGNTFMINECEKGVSCGYCHSKEELLYHPLNYKTKVCKSSTGHACKFGDVCPYQHPNDRVQHYQKKTNTGDNRQRRGKICIPYGAPMLYVSPAPSSNFDRYLLLPGLQNLFRRQSAVVKASMSKPVGRSLYSPFGDDWGILGS
eukprot:CAMPEP_0202478460 /NCGR_PEP_ID=MMETSP1360-20130828/94470_1 /ASSEMBLY_ACC=CAM_ASM_000848 /TAXON_ID=515479 /ORGANISM="Licmophora paradoxa, Strain CCMP2313" /LENGTH=847 /DNA_ID=CAMNT_0049105739 /DNA_START=1773 /DNA_END=4316 /DNA_ORIENTATION=-